MRPRWYLVVISVFVAIGVMALPPVARATSVSIYDDPYSDFTILDVFAGFDDEVNTVSLEGDARHVRVTDLTTPVFTGSYCTPLGPSAAMCTAPAGRRLSHIQTYLGGAGDRLTDDVTGLRTDSNLGFGGVHYHDGGEGRDRLVGSDGDSDYMFGGNGSDLVRGRGGDDTLAEETFSFGGNQSGRDNLRGGAGDDILRGGPGSDLLVGGPGIDRVEYAQPLPAGAQGVRVDLAGNTTGNGRPRENDQIVDVEDATGTSGNDTLLGSAAGNVLDGLAGDDLIAGGASPDTLLGRAGADRLFAADGEADRVSCGGPDPGDRAEVDAADTLSGCPAEGAGLTTRSPVPGAPPPGSAPAADDSAPGITVTAARRIRRAELIRSGVRVLVRSTDAVRNRATATLLARPRVTRATAGDLVLAERRRSFLRRTTMRLKPAKRLRRAVRRDSRLRLRIVVQDPAGNRASRTGRIRVR